MAVFGQPSFAPFGGAAWRGNEGQAGPVLGPHGHRPACAPCRQCWRSAGTVWPAPLLAERCLSHDYVEARFCAAAAGSSKWTPALRIIREGPDNLLAFGPAATGPPGAKGLTCSTSELAECHPVCAGGKGRVGYLYEGSCRAILVSAGRGGAFLIRVDVVSCTC